MAKKKNTSNSLPTNEQVQKYEMFNKMFESLFTELKSLSAKKPDEPLNKFKVQTINRILKELKVILGAQPTLGFLDLLDEDSIPTNSDAVLILSQFKAALKHFHDSYFEYDGFEHRWRTKENP